MMIARVFVMMLAATWACGCGPTEAPLPPAPPVADDEVDESDRAVVTIVSPRTEEPLEAGELYDCVVRFKLREGDEPPRAVYADFARGDVIAGQHQSRPAELVPVAGAEREYECTVKVKAPPSPGNYTLQSKLVWKRSFDKASQMTIPIKVVAAVEE